MCKCTPEIRTPFCGKPGCEPGQSSSKEKVCAVCAEPWALGHRCKPTQTAAERLAETVVRNVCELPDYTSPDDQPDLLTCTVDELNACVVRAVEAASAHESHPANPTEQELHTEIERLQRSEALLLEIQTTMGECICVEEGQTFEDRAEELIVTEVQHMHCSTGQPRADAEAIAAVPALKDKRALVLYFQTDADRDEFVALIHEAKPGMRTVKL